MKHQIIVSTQNALAKDIRAKLNANENQHDMVTSSLMNAIASFEIASQLALLNNALEALGEAKPTPKAIALPDEPIASPEAPPQSDDASVQTTATPTPKPKGVRKIPSVPAPSAGAGRVVKRVTKPEAPAPAPAKPAVPAAAAVADLIQPPLDNYSPDFDQAVEEGQEMDAILDALGME